MLGGVRGSARIIQRPQHSWRGARFLKRKQAQERAFRAAPIDVSHPPSSSQFSERCRDPSLSRGSGRVQILPYAKIPAAEERWARDDAFDGCEWSMVKPKHWWRKEQSHSKFPPTSGSSLKALQRPKSASYLRRLKGKCFNCLASDHSVASCRDPTRCWCCFRFGHRSSTCKLKYPELNPPRSASSRPPSEKAPPPLCQGSPSTLSIPPLPPCAEFEPSRLLSNKPATSAITSPMASYPGDPAARPLEVFAAVAATGDIERRKEMMLDRAAVCWLAGNRPETGPSVLSDALMTTFRIGVQDCQLVKHHPEDFHIIFASRRVRDEVVSAHRLPYRGRDFRFAAWSERRYADSINWGIRVRLRIEGLLAHAWFEEVAALAIGRECSIHYVEEQSRRRERTRTYDLWAWCNNPSLIPKLVWLTITEADRELPPTSIPRYDVEIHYDMPSDVKRGQSYRLFIHLEVIHDLVFLTSNPPDPRRSNRGWERILDWHYGSPDGGVQVDILPQRPCRSNGGGGRRDCDGDTDDEHQRCSPRRHRSRSLWARLSRPVRDEDSAVRGRDDRGRYGRRRDGTAPLQSASPPRSPARRLQQGTQLRQWRKKVSFATPVATLCKPRRPPSPRGDPVPLDCFPSSRRGPAPCGFDPMLLELASSFAAPSSTSMALSLPSTVASQAAGDGLAACFEGEYNISIFPDGEATAVDSTSQQRFEQPLTKEAGEVIKALVEKGNQIPKKIGKARVVPAEPVAAGGTSA